MKNSGATIAPKAASGIVGDRECSATCCRFAHKTKRSPGWRRRLAAKSERFEWKAGLLASSILARPAIALILLTVIIFSYPGDGQSKTDEYKAVGTASGTPFSMSLSKSPEVSRSGLWEELKSRVVSRWTVLLALGGLLSLLKVLDSVAKSESRYLILDLAIDPPKTGDGNVLLTTIVENKLEDDRKIHNALILVGSAHRPVSDLFQSLCDHHGQIRQRVWCGQQIDTWLIREKEVHGGSILSNFGATWVAGEYPKPEIADLDCFLAACPLDAHPLVAGSGPQLALIQSLTFYFDENDDIANERVSFPVALESRLFEPGHPYIVRFYVIGEQLYPAPETMSRCTARAFVVPVAPATIAS